MFSKLACLSLLCAVVCNGLGLDLSMRHGDLFPGGSSRRMALIKGTSTAVSGLTFTAGFPRRANAANGKSRTRGYPVQKSDDEWKSTLTQRQFEILREGGTERPYTSILEGEDRSGTFYCAGCKTPLFDSEAKFHSGTGWPSFATALKGVEVETINPLQANFVGAELRCATCGGHLGDVFMDGWIFQGTPAAESGKRFCIDGSALVFEPSDGNPSVIGDLYPEKPARPEFS